MSSRLSREEHGTGFRVAVERAIAIKSDDNLADICAQMRVALGENEVATSRDLDWWPFEGHRINPIADFRLLPLYLLYKTVLYASKVDHDSGIDPRPVWHILNQSFFDARLGFLLSVRFSRELFEGQATSIQDAVSSELDFWSTNAPIRPESAIPAIQKLLSSFATASPSDAAFWFAMQGLMDRAVRGPYLPFLDLELAGAKWLDILSSPFAPYARVIAGLDRAELSCHWNASGWSLHLRNYDEGLRRRARMAETFRGP